MRTQDSSFIYRLNTLAEVGYIDRETFNRYQRNEDCRGLLNYINRRWELWQRESTAKLLKESNQEIEMLNLEIAELTGHEN